MKPVGQPIANLPVPLHQWETSHIGIVGCSAAGAALCFRVLCEELSANSASSGSSSGHTDHSHPEVSLHTYSLGQYVRSIERGAWGEVAQLMLSSATKLIAGGATVIVCPDNTIHQAWPLLQAHIPRSVRWLHIAEVVIDEAVRRGFRALGLLGTQWLVDIDVYPAACATRGIVCVRPTPTDRRVVHHIIMEQLTIGKFDAEATAATLNAVIQRLGAGDVRCDAVVLGCTELPLVIGDHNSPLATLDSARLLAKAALRAVC